jgi:hypothetical protein
MPGIWLVKMSSGLIALGKDVSQRISALLPSSISFAAETRQIGVDAIRSRI